MNLKNGKAKSNMLMKLYQVEPRTPCKTRTGNSSKTQYIMYYVLMCIINQVNQIQKLTCFWSELYFSKRFYFCEFSYPLFCLVIDRGATSQGFLLLFYFLVLCVWSSYLNYPLNNFIKAVVILSTCLDDMSKSTKDKEIQTT